jgi:glycosyltransferase involved in cell wall biosynthesis
MLRIALVTPMLPVPHDQTRGRYIHETARSLGKLATVRTFFQTMQYPRIPGFKPRSFIYGSVGPDYQLDGCDVEAFTFPGIPVLSRGYNGHIASLALTPRVRRFKPDLVLAYWVYPDGFAALRTARALGVPCIVGALGSDIHVRAGVNEQMTRRTIGGIDALLTVSEAMRQYSIREFAAAPDKVHTIINGFNTAVFKPIDQIAMRAKHGIKPDEKLIIYVGRFVEAKGMRELITAFQQLAKADPKVTLALVGDGVMKGELMELVRSTGLLERVHLPGGLAPEAVAEWINAADVLTLPSWSEGYPNVVVEGVACGRPVVATDVGGTREILHNGNGILIPPKDASRLATALRDALNGEWDHAGIAAAMSRTWDDVAVETLAVCEQVVKAGKKR